MTFNVQNLFDGIKNGEEYKEYRPPKWNKNAYEERLIAIGKAIQSVKQSIDLIVLQEVENQGVLEDLQRYYLPTFKHIAITNNPHGAVEVAIMSRHEILSTNTHTLQDIKPDAQFHTLRPVLDVSIAFSTPTYEKLQILGVHLKSHRKSRTALSSDEIRSYQYQLISQVIDTRIPSIIAGDFNDTAPIEHLLRYDAQVLQLPTSTSQNAQGYRGIDISGTYYYKSQWQQIDHILIDVVFDKIVQNKQNTIIAQQPFITNKGLPNRFYKNNRAHAVSDHLPLIFSASW